MASQQKNGVNGAMAEQKESSVLFSLKELMSLEENRIKEEEDAKKKRVEEEIRAKEDAERRAREEEEARLRAEEERRRSDELRRKMEEAQVEAAKTAEIDKRRLEEQHRLQMEALAKQQAHEKEIHVIQSQKRKGIHPGILAAIGALLVGSLVLVVYFVSIKPHNTAKEAIARAQNEASSSDEAQWDEADKDLAIARANDPSNPDIATLGKKIQDKRDALAADLKKKADEAAAQQAAIIKDLQDKLSSAKTPEEVAELQKQLDAANKKKAGGFTGGGTAKPGGGPAKPCVCPPGVPLCNC
jgi:colicin import membrane protein